MLQMSHTQYFFFNETYLEGANSKLITQTIDNFMQQYMNSYSSACIIEKEAKEIKGPKAKYRKQ